jgi:putative oxidoreductase
MKTAASVARFLLGLVLVVFGLNGFLNFMPMGPVPALAAQFVGALIQSHYMVVVLVLEIVSGFLLLTNRYALLATALIAPIIVNIVLFHVFMAPAGLPLAALVTALWIVNAHPYRALLSPLFERRFHAGDGTESRVSPRHSLARPA